MRHLDMLRYLAFVLWLLTAVLLIAPEFYPNSFSAPAPQTQSSDKVYGRSSWMYLNTSKPIDAGIVVSGNLTLTGYTLSVGGIGGNPIPWLYVVTYSVFSAWNPNSGAPSNPAFFSMDFIYVSALRTVLVPFNFTAPDSSIYYFLIGTYYPKTTFTLSAAYRSRAWWVTPLTFILGIPAGVLVLPEHTLRRLGKKFTRGSRRSRKEKNLGPRS